MFETLRTIFRSTRNRIIIIAIVIAAGGGWYYFSARTASDTAANQPETASVTRGELYLTVTGTGSVAAREQVDLKPVVAGDAIDVISVTVTNDQAVRRGDLIAVLDTTEPQKAVRDAEVSLQSERVKERQVNDANPAQTEKAGWTRRVQKLLVKQRENDLADARDDLQDYSIRAPFDGVVTGLSVAAGDSISRDDILASVITQAMVAVISLNEVDAAKVQQGQPVLLVFDALPDTEVRGNVTKVDTIGTVSQGVVTYDVEIELQTLPERLKPGMSVNATITIETRSDALLVPSAAVRSDASGTYVLAPRNGAAASPRDTLPTPGNTTETDYRRVPVTVGLTDNVSTEIVRGLTEGDTIIVRLPSAVSSDTSAGSSQRSLFPFGPGSGQRSR